MPKRAQRAHRDRLEAEASPAVRALLREFRESCALGQAWDAVEPLAAVVSQLTAMQLAHRLRAAGLAEDAALERAAAYLGIPADTIRTRHQRWYRATHAASFHVEPAADPPPASASGMQDRKPEPGAAA